MPSNTVGRSKHRADTVLAQSVAHTRAVAESPFIQLLEIQNRMRGDYGVPSIVVRISGA